MGSLKRQEGQQSSLQRRDGHDLRLCTQVFKFKTLDLPSACNGDGIPGGLLNVNVPKFEGPGADTIGDFAIHGFVNLVGYIWLVKSHAGWWVVGQGQAEC